MQSPLRSLADGLWQARAAERHMLVVASSADGGPAQLLLYGLLQYEPALEDAVRGLGTVKWLCCATPACRAHGTTWQNNFPDTLLADPFTDSRLALPQWLDGCIARQGSRSACAVLFHQRSATVMLPHLPAPGEAGSRNGIGAAQLEWVMQQPFRRLADTRGRVIEHGAREYWYQATKGRQRATF